MVAQTVTTSVNADDVGFIFVGVSNAATTAMSSPIGFITWTARTLSASANWNGVACSGDHVMALASSGLTNTSLDGITWASYGNIGTGTAWSDLAFGDGYFVAVNASGTLAAYTSLRRGIYWTTATLPASGAWSHVAFGNNTFVTVIPSTTSAAYSTNNGATWNSVTLPAALNWSALRFGNGYFVLIANGSQDVYTSSDGITWNLQSAAMPSAAAWAALSWISGGTNGIWAATASSGNQAAYSTDNGVTWSAATMPVSDNWKALCGGKTNLDGRQVFIAARQSQTTAGGAYSFDGLNWYSFTTTSAAWNRLAWVDVKWDSADTLTINNGATVTVNTNQSKWWNTITITNGKLKIENTSTTDVIRFGTGKLTASNAINSITPSSGLGSVEVDGYWVEIGTSNGTAGQTFTSPYSTGDYIACLQIEKTPGSGDYEVWGNATGFRDFDVYNYYRTGLRSVGKGSGGKVFIQDPDQTAVQYFDLPSCDTITGSAIIKCTSTAGLVPGTWLTGRGIPANAVVERIIDSTTFKIHLLVTTGYTGIPIAGFKPICSQYSTTLRFGDGYNGEIPPSGCKIRIANILITDFTAANFQITNISSSNAPASFVGTNGGLFTFNKCLFGESYSNYTQAAKFFATDCGFSYVPFVSECYQVSINRVAFALPPVVQYVTAATALGATGTTTASSPNITTPATTALIPGVMITSANTHPSYLLSRTTNTNGVLSRNAHTSGSGNVAFTYYGLWTVRDQRMMAAQTQALGSAFSAISWSLISGAVFNDVLIIYGGHLISGANSNAGLAGAGAGAFNTSFSNNVTVNNLKVIQVGSYPRTRPYQAAINLSSAGANLTFDNVEVYNMNVLGASAVSNITLKNVTHRPGINNEGYGLISGYRAFSDPENDGYLSLDTKYWFKPRSYRTIDIQDGYSYIDGFKVCGVLSSPEKYLQPPRYQSAVPNYSVVNAPTLAYGNGYWVALNGAIGGQTAHVSDDDGATWTTVMMPVAAGTASWWKIIYCPGNSMFMAIGGGTIASTICAYSYNGTDWGSVTTAPASQIWQAIAYDASQATVKWVGVSGGNAVSTAATSAVITNGSLVFSARTLASAQWIDVAASGAGRYVAIAGGTAVGTATSYSTNGTSWTAGGANASSLWQSIAYGSGRFVCISASAVNGPTAYSADAVTWTASTAPSLPTGMNWNKIIWTGTVFVILAGPTPLTVAAPGATSASQCYATSSDGITWSAIKYLPDMTFWASCANNGNAVGFVSTQTGMFAYTADITAGTPTWTINRNCFSVWNKLSWFSQAPEYNPTAPTVTSVATTLNSTTVTCASTAGLYVGAVMVITNAVPVGAAYLGTGAALTQTYAVIVTSITNSTTFEINKPAMRTATGLTGTFYRHSYTIFRSTTEGFTDRDSTLIGSTTGVGSTGAFIFEDPINVQANTTYYYRIRKQSGYNAMGSTCSGTAATSTITTSASFYNWRTSTEIEGVSGTNVLFTRVTGTGLGFYAWGIVPGCIVTGTGIPDGTTVVSVDDFNSITISNNLTSDVIARGASRTTVGFSPAPGMYIYGSNVGLNSQVVSVDSATSMTVSVNNTNTFTNQAIIFAASYELPEMACIPQIPAVIQNNALQSTTLATTWVASGITATSAAALGPLDNFVAINAAAPTGTASSLLATATDGTLTQTIQTGVGTNYNFSVYARARVPNNTNNITMKLDLGTASQTFNITNKWTRYWVNFTTTSNTTNAVITLPQFGSLIEVAATMVVSGTDTPPVPTTPTTTTIAYLAPQHMFTTAAVAGCAGYLIDGGSGIEFTLLAAPAGTLYTHLHTSALSGFSINDRNQLFSTHLPQATDVTIGVATSALNILIDTYTPANDYAPNHAMLLYATSGASGLTVKDAKHSINGTASRLFDLTSASPAYNAYFHNIDLINYRGYLAAFYLDGTVANNSKGVILQNIRSNRSARFAFTSQGLDTIYKGVAGTDIFPSYNGLNWNISTDPTIAGFPLTNTTVYDNMFHEMTFNNGTGCLHLTMSASSKEAKPYTIISGAPYFSNEGNLFFTGINDQIVIEWPHKIQGVTGFDKRLPQIYGTDVGLDLVTSLGVLVEYDLDKGSGYSGSWKRITSTINNLYNETGIDPLNGFRIKFRLTARKGLKYTGQSSQFVVGETIWNATSNPTATFTVDEDEVSGATTTGTLIVSNVTGEWNTANTLYSTAGATRATITATNADVFFPQPTSKINAIRIFTTTNTSETYNYPYAVSTVRLTGLVAGSEVRAYNGTDPQTMTEIAGTESSGTTFEFTHSLDNVAGTIVIFAMNYQAVRLNTTYVASSAPYIIPIQQITDRVYLNP